MSSRLSDMILVHESEEFENTGDVPENLDLPDPQEQGEEYTKTAPTWALQMDKDFDVETIEGPIPGKEGDYLAKGPEGDMWVVDQEVFKKTYEPTSDDISDLDSVPQLPDDIETPKMESVFKIKEMGMDSVMGDNPPPGAQKVQPSQWMKMGQVGQAAQTGLDALNKAGQDLDAYVTPEGEFLAYPKMKGPGSIAMRADLTKGGIWSPVTGSSL